MSTKKESHCGAFGFGPGDLVQLDVREEPVKGQSAFPFIYCLCWCHFFLLYKLLAESLLG